MWLDLMRPDILVISRPKVDGLVRHFGVDFQDGRVVHLLFSGEIEFTTPDGFALGHDVAIEKVIPAEKYLEIVERLRSVLLNPRPYYAATWNCETFATWLTEGKAESAQVAGYVALALLAATAAALAR